MSDPSNDVVGHCPACGAEDLFLGSGGYVTCAREDCPEPSLVSDLLGKRDQHVHLIRFDEEGFTAQHPLIERLRPEGLFACDLGEQLRALSGPPGIGMFRIRPGGTLDDIEQVDEGDVEFEAPATPASPEVTQQTLTSAIPLGTLVAIPASMPTPDGFIVAQQEMRLPVAAYPALAEAMIEQGFEPVEDDGLLVVAIDMPLDADAGPSGRFVLRVS